MGRGEGSLSVVLTPEFTISHLDDQMWRFLTILTHPMVHPRLMQTFWSLWGPGTHDNLCDWLFTMSVCLSYRCISMGTLEEAPQWGMPRGHQTESTLQAIRVFRSDTIPPSLHGQDVCKPPNIVPRKVVSFYDYPCQ